MFLYTPAHLVSTVLSINVACSKPAKPTGVPAGNDRRLDCCEIQPCILKKVCNTHCDDSGLTSCWHITVLYLDTLTLGVQLQGSDDAWIVGKPGKVANDTLLSVAGLESCKVLFRGHVVGYCRYLSISHRHEALCEWGHCVGRYLTVLFHFTVGPKSSGPPGREKACQGCQDR